MALTDKDENKLVNSVVTDNIIDINIDGATRTRYRINGDPSAIIELNLSDLSLIDRLKTGIDKLQKEMDAISQLSSDDENLSEKLKQADQRMRECVDYIFDYPVSAVCAKHGTMYDPKNGKFRYEIIIDGLTKLYSENINEEYKKFSARIKKHTDKYTENSKKKGQQHS